MTGVQTCALPICFPVTICGLTRLLDQYTDDYDSDEYRDLEIEDVVNTGEMRATMHLLSVATDILEGKPVGRE